MKKVEPVKAWKETIVIPTYEVGEPEKYPIFPEKRVYQGSSGTVYPHPIIEKISNEKIEKEWEVIYLENTYLKIMVLPALGGRIQMAYDKIKQRHFVYFNEVIKPALVGLTGPWISGGIEFNWPQHHRPSTYDPVDCTIEHYDDGSVTVWVSEVERMFRTKGMAGFTLYPDKAYIEIKGKLYNRTPHPQTFLWWANPAVAVNDYYQSVFPEDVNAVFDHGKRDVSTFPIASGTYYKVDYSKGVDISRYKNIPVPTSYMAVNSKHDFVGGYENDTQSGLLHVADHHISPGKKQWTWGKGDFGHAWDRNLTDENGPYVELMCGVYTDNQPDFSWIQPYEERNFTQYFMPYQKAGVVKNATKEALLNVTVEDGKMTLVVYATGEFPNCKITLSAGSNQLLEEEVDICPQNPYTRTIDFTEKPEAIMAEVCNAEGQILVNYVQKSYQDKPIPEPAKPALDPADIPTAEELWLTGMHIEQYRHATYDPMDYYREALSRNPTDIRSNNAMGLLLLRSGKLNDAIGYFESSIKTLTKYNPNPNDGEPFYNLGITLRICGREQEAYDQLFKATWNSAWQDAAFFNLAQIDLKNGNTDRAMELVDRSLLRNWHNHKARHLKAMIHRKKGEKSYAIQLIKDSLAIDQFNFGMLFEKYLWTNDQRDKANFKLLIRDYVHNYIEYALDYAQAGQYEDAIALLKLHLEDKTSGYPMAYYSIGYFYGQLGEKPEALSWFKLAAVMPTDFCFPNRLEEIIILQNAIASNPKDHNAYYYLGNFWMSKKQYADAKACWETALEIQSESPMVLRNLSLLYFNKFSKKELALTCLEKAFSLDSDNARILMELDQLYKRLNGSTKFRLEFLESHLGLVNQRDDLYLEYITLLNIEKRHLKALQLIKERQFHPWEGGEGKVPAQYILANIELAKKAMLNEEFNKALQFLFDAQEYPLNLGEGKLFGAQENDVFYWLGCVYYELGNELKSREYWEMASKGSEDLSPALFYNDQSPDKIFYQGLAHQKLGNKFTALSLFNKLIDYGESHLFDEIKIDYFAVSLPDLLIWDDDLNKKNKVHCNYLIGLGKMGLCDRKGALSAFEAAYELDPYHLGIITHKRFITGKLKSFLEL
ncbi:MAG: DUF5107 domain-containing protein [Cyclobacteriaceae bacterium]|nr:DUF5107 domain-containing protein [Cyclobacteriaceae bacterium]